MTEEQILKTLMKTTAEVIYGLEESGVRGDRTLNELGASSIERSDILLETLDQVGLQIPAIKLRDVAGKTLEQVATVFYGWLVRAQDR